MERLQKVIAECGICSRRHAEELILQNRVKVNGVIVNVLGSKVESTDIIEVDGKFINKEKYVYYLLNKPSNVITTSSDTHERKTVLDCIKTSERVFAVGRLDYDTTGVIILTNDGDLSYHLMHPKFEVNKTYVAYCKGIIDEDIAKILTKTVILEDGPAKAKSVKVLSYDDKKNTYLEITLSVGKKHIVKRLVQYLGSSCIHLHRKAIEFISDEGLNIGEYRKLTSEEVSKLKSL